MKPPDQHYRNLVIRASAGTGKTFQLSNRLIGLASANEPLDSILAATFTRKAAGEILDRVLKRLGDAVQDDNELANLSKHVGDSSLDRQHCLGILYNLVHALHRLHVSTLDSFFSQIARSYSLELGLPHGWQIIDEIDDQRLRAEAIGRVLQDGSTHDTVRLMNLLTKGEASRSVSQQITGLVNGLYGIFLEAPEGAWRSLRRHKGLSRAALEAALATLSTVEVPDDRRFENARCEDLHRARAEHWEAFIQKGLAAKVLDGVLQYYRRPIPAELAAAYGPLLEHAKAVLVGQIANQTEATRGLLDRFDSAYQRLKIASRALRFDDVTRTLGQAWVAERIDKIVYRLDVQLRHLLLDEFQDTSPMQWRALRPFARRVTGGGEHRSFFCVGDVKQAIYGWRGGVAEIMDAVTRELACLETTALNESRRSSLAVIETVNRVFDHLADSSVMQKYPAAARQWSDRFARHTTARRRLPGYCRLVTAPRAAPGIKQTVGTQKFAAHEIATLSGQCPDHTLGVLVRDNQSVARLIYELRRIGVDASEEGGVSLVDSPGVQVLLSLLNLADHPGDTTARFHVASSPLARNLGLANHTDSAAAWRVSEQVRRSLMTDGYGPVLYGWTEQLAPSCDRRDRNRLMRLVEIAYAYDARATPRVDDFVSLVQQQKTEDPTTAKVRVMTVHQAKGLEFDIVVLPQLDVRMTGQSPQAVVKRPTPDAAVECVCRYVSGPLRSILPHDLSKVFDEHQRRVVEESLCVLYVALTRAKHALHLIIDPAKDNERTIPSTMAGVLRTTLTDGGKSEPGCTVYQHGDPEWYRAAAAESLPAPTAVADEAAAQKLTIRLLEPRGRVVRNLQRRSPSSLEGGTRVDLAQRLRLDTTGALERGTLLHAWFELVEWLEDSDLDDLVLKRVADQHRVSGPDLTAAIGQFRTTLAKPPIRALLSRTTYQCPTGGPLQSAVRPAAGARHSRWQVWRERPFAVRHDDAILTGSIDRLVVLYDGDQPVAADVIDFKTDAIQAGQPKMIEARVEFYRVQIDAYRYAVSRLFALEASQISARLAFVTPGIIRKV